MARPDLPPSRRSRHDVLVLCYHGVSQAWPSELAVTPDALAGQLRYLRGRGYRGVTFSDAVLGRHDTKVVAITFDDAYLSVAQLARPIIERFEMPGTVFVPTGQIGDGPMSWPGIDQWLGTEHEHELTPMSWDDAAALVAGGWEVGSHTRSHPHLTEVSDVRLREELVGSREDCEAAVGGRCRSIAFPYGDHDERVVNATGDAGYEAAGTLPVRLAPSFPLRWPRIGIYRADDERSFRVKVSPLVRRARASRLAPPLTRAARRALRRSGS